MIDNEYSRHPDKFSPCGCSGNQMAQATSQSGS
jgi:hypothetical protein